MGKTTLWRQIKKIDKETNILMDYISEDDIWKNLMDEVKLKNPSINETKCFWQVFEEGNRLFWNEMK